MDSADGPTAAEQLLRSLAARGVDRVYANLGTDHTPLVEAVARVRQAGDGDAVPVIQTVPHEFAAMSAAHGEAAATGEPAAVLVHVDVGTQNLGAAMHNAHRANVPVLVMAGLAPVTHGGRPGARDHAVHYFQDVFDQPGIVREYCRWVGEYRPPADPDELVARALDRATAPNPGPVYLAATREALEWADDRHGRPVADRTARVRPSVPTPADLDRLAGAVADAERPLALTSQLGAMPGAADRVDALVRFAEAAGAGVVEHAPTALCFPRTHELHAGFEPAPALEGADLVLLAAAAVPWVPADGGPAPDATVIQLAADPTERTYPQWPFAPDDRFAVDSGATLGALADRLEADGGSAGRAHWREAASGWRAAAEGRAAEARETGRLSPASVSAAVDGIVDGGTTVLEDGVTSKRAILEALALDRPGSYHSKGGAGLGWTGGAAVGAAIARPEDRVLALVGDGGYLFSQPAACAWLSAAAEAPTLTVVYDDGGWNAVATSTRAAHPDGAAAAAGVPGSRFVPRPDLTAPAGAVDSFTARAATPRELKGALADAVQAVDGGRPAVVVAELDRRAGDG